MQANVRMIKESPIYQGTDEAIAWQVDVSNWVSAPTTPVVKIYKAADNSDMTSTLLTGSASVSGDIITCPRLSGLTADTQYRLEVKFTVSGNTYEAWATVHGQ